jgi:integrase/recombinase XerD
MEMFFIARSTELSKRTQETYRYDLNRLKRWLAERGIALQDATLWDLRYWLHNLQSRDVKFVNHPFRKPEAGKLSSNTIAAAVKVVKLFFAWLAEEGLIEVNPAAELPRVRGKRGEVKFLDEDEVAQLLIACDALPRDVAQRRARALCMLFFDSGARETEIAKLQVDQLYLNKHLAIIEGKGGRKEFIFFLPATTEALREWLEVRGQVAKPNCPFVFVSFGGITPGQGMSRNGLYQIVRRIGKAAGVRVDLHTLRRTMSTLFIDEDVGQGNMRHLQGLLRHAQITTTEKYTEINARRLKRAHEAHSPLHKILELTEKIGTLIYPLYLSPSVP